LIRLPGAFRPEAAAHGFYEDIVIFLTISLITGLIAFFMNVRRCRDRQISKALRLSKAMQLLAMEIDKQTNRDHKDALSTLESDVYTILRNDMGNL